MVRAHRPRRARRLLLAPPLLLAALSLALAPSDAEPPRVLVSTVDGTIGPVVHDFVDDGVDRAEEDGYAAYVLVLDTPGGLATSMTDIVQRFLEAEVPVVVHVAPRGARAGSAGTMITMAAHVAAMAPGTVIGAATPVDLQEGGEVNEKVVNDAAAMAESIARLRDRDVDFAVDAVREGRSIPVDEAVRIGAVDLRASSLDQLLEEIDGTEVELASGREVELRTAGAGVDELEMGLFRRILQLLADPNLAFLFLTLGTLGLLYELATPGVGAGGILAVILVALALFSLSVLPVNAVGLLLLALAAGLFVAELFAPGVGAFAALGAGSLLLSGLFLFDDATGVSVSLAVVLPTSAVALVAAVVAGRLALRSRQAPPAHSGVGALIGRTAEVRRPYGDRPQAFVEGAWWALRADRPLRTGQRVHVVDVDGLDLVVEPVEGPTATEEEDHV